MEELIPYLGGDKFRDLEKMASRYQEEDLSGRRLVSESIRLEEM
jgi:hypothetical protein